MLWDRYKRGRFLHENPGSQHTHNHHNSHHNGLFGNGHHNHNGEHGSDGVQVPQPAATGVPAGAINGVVNGGYDGPPTHMSSPPFMQQQQQVQMMPGGYYNTPDRRTKEYEIQV